MSLPPDPAQVEALARRIRALILDVDGVMTDGRILYLPGGGEYKAFNVRDGLGVKMLLAAGIQCAIISGRASEVVERRAAELGIHPVLQGIDDKVFAFEDLAAQFECADHEIAYIGDDLPDLPLLERAGLGFAVADACPEVRARAHVVLRAGGGQGAVREACELLLRARGAWMV
jgi:3-deoxy-D-manno-octulosonate 8-phosphate phosphatase (KDO 8-P phosphatase)